MKQTRTLSIDGMSCEDCVRQVTDALNTVSGLQINSVGIGVAEVTFDPEEVDEKNVLSAVSEAGFQPQLAA